MKRISLAILFPMLYAVIITAGLWLSSCGGKLEVPLSEQAIQEALKNYFAEDQNMNIDVIEFSKTKEEHHKDETTKYYSIDFQAQIQLPPAGWGIIVKNIKGSLTFYDAGGSWPLEDAQISTTNSGIKAEGIKSYFFDDSPIGGINCPYDRYDFITAHSDKCLGCEKNGRQVKVIWAGTLKCLDCSGTGICSYCNKSAEESEMKCTKCAGSGKCDYCELGLKTPGKDFGEACKYCDGTGECKYCRNAGIACYYCGSTKKCFFCKGNKTLLREDFTKEGKLVESKD